MIAMSGVIAVDATGVEHKVGSMHHDVRGYVAWDKDGQWLGKTERSRFPSRSSAFKALEDAFAKATGVPVSVSRFAGISA